MTRSLMKVIEQTAPFAFGVANEHFCSKSCDVAMQIKFWRWQNFYAILFLVLWLISAISPGNRERKNFLKLAGKSENRNSALPCSGCMGHPARLRLRYHATLWSRRVENDREEPSSCKLWSTEKYCLNLSQTNFRSQKIPKSAQLQSDQIICLYQFHVKSDLPPNKPNAFETKLDIFQIKNSFHIKLETIQKKIRVIVCSRKILIFNFDFNFLKFLWGSNSTTQ